MKVKANSREALQWFFADFSMMFRHPINSSNSRKQISSQLYNHK